MNEALVFDDNANSGLRSLAGIEFTADSSAYAIKQQFLYQMTKFRPEDLSQREPKPKCYMDAEINRMSVKTLEHLSSAKMDSLSHLMQSRSIFYKI